MDAFRGLIMIVMALDHVRDFFHFGAMVQDPLDLNTTYPILYFTRWITHFCAPNFVFLAGIGAYLYGEKRGKKALQSFLLSRGIWLILLEFTVITLGWFFDPEYHFFAFQVIYVTGISMILLAIFLNFKPVIIFLVALLILLLHNIYDFYPLGNESQKAGFWLDIILYKYPQVYDLNSNHHIFMLYSFLVFSGIMFFGYSFGALFSKNYSPEHRKTNLIWSGAGMISLFVVLRLYNYYGDPVPWEKQENFFSTFLSFIKVNKYPPSLDYVALTIGIGLLFLAWINTAKGWIIHFLSVYGKVPFFYYILHLYIIHGFSVFLFTYNGYPIRHIINNTGRPFGFHLWVVYLLWFGVIAILYPLCLWYNSYKKTHTYWWLKYI